MKTCERFEVQVEQRAQGALPADELAGLVSHLGECASCRAFAALVEGVQSGLRARAEQYLGQVDWGRVQARVRRQSTVLAAAPWVLAAVAGVEAIAVALGVPPSEVVVAELFLLGVWGATVVAAVLILRRWRRALAHAGPTREGLRALYLRDLDARRRSLRLALAFVLCCTVGGLLGAAGAETGVEQAAFVIVPALWAAGAGFIARALRRVERERGAAA